MSEIPVPLHEVASGKIVRAALDLDLGPYDLEAIEKVWGPLRRDAARQIARERGPTAAPQHWQWDWRSKARLLQFPTFRCLGIRHAGEIQGLAMVDADLHHARVAPDTGKPIMYVEFLEVAPWNCALVTPRRFTPVGPRLMEAIVRLSEEAGYHGRTGLHALPQSEEFYRRCKMTEMDPDPKKENLRYFEMTRTQATAFVQAEDMP